MTSKSCIMIYGDVGSGKSWAALSLSAKWPGVEEVLKRTPRSPKLILDDIVWLNWEPTGLNGLAPYNIEVEYNIDVLDIIYEEGSFELGWAAAVAMMHEIVDQNEIIAVVNDTLTSADNRATAYYFHPQRAPKGASGIDTRGCYGLIKRFHIAYQAAVSELSKDVSEVYLAHTKLDDSSDEFSKQRKGVGLVNKRPAITGAGYQVYTAPCELVLPMDRVYGGKGNSTKRSLLADVAAKQHYVKNRYEGIIAGKLEPDLKKLLALVNRAKGT